MPKLCPCHSKKDYETCCKLFHENRFLANPEQLMRSRYSAYAMGLALYIIKTTHKMSPFFNTDKKSWTTEIMKFSKSTTFEDLTIISHSEEGDVAYVTFFARMTERDLDISRTEKSTFKKVDNSWLYFDGICENGLAFHLA